VFNQSGFIALQNKKIKNLFLKVHQTSGITGQPAVWRVGEETVLIR